MKKQDKTQDNWKIIAIVAIAALVMLCLVLLIRPWGYGMCFNGSRL